jgi:hypothetical protein
MEDLAQTVMEQLRVDDGASPFVALATWKDHRNDRWWSHVMVVPVTQNGTTSYNVETMEWTVYGSSVKAFQFEDEWKPEKVCNFATVEKAAEFLMATAKSHHRPNNERDLPQVPLVIGPLNWELINKRFMYLENVEGIKHMIEMLTHMRPTVEV